MSENFSFGWFSGSYLTQCCLTVGYFMQQNCTDDSILYIPCAVHCISQSVCVCVCTTVCVYDQQSLINVYVGVKGWSYKEALKYLADQHQGVKNVTRMLCVCLCVHACLCVKALGRPLGMLLIIHPCVLPANDYWLGHVKYGEGTSWWQLLCCCCPLISVWREAHRGVGGRCDVKLPAPGLEGLHIVSGRVGWFWINCFITVYEEQTIIQYEDELRWWR